MGGWVGEHGSLGAGEENLGAGFEAEPGGEGAAGISEKAWRRWLRKGVGISIKAPSESWIMSSRLFFMFGLGCLWTGD